MLTYSEQKITMISYKGYLKDPDKHDGSRYHNLCVSSAFSATTGLHWHALEEPTGNIMSWRETNHCNAMEGIQGSKKLIYYLFELCNTCTLATLFPNFVKSYIHLPWFDSIFLYSNLHLPEIMLSKLTGLSDYYLTFHPEDCITYFPILT